MQMSVGANYDSACNCYRIRITRLDRQAIERLIATVRTLKQSDVPVAVIEVRGDSENPTCGIGPESTYSQRLEWSKRGQLLTNIIAGSSTYFIAMIDGPCYGESFELAMACHLILWREGVATGLAPEDTVYFPRWGGLDRLNEQFGQRGAITRLLAGRHNEIRDAVKAQTGVPLATGESAEKALSALSKRVASTGLDMRRLGLAAVGADPTKNTAAQFLEATVFANGPQVPRLEQIRFLPPADVEDNLMNNAIRPGEDDMTLDYAPFDCYPDTEIDLLKRKRRFEEVELLISQTQAPLRGRCIELGSGHGYFSAMLSRKPEVEEAVAFDISASTTLRWGPLIWERLKPDWSKLRYVIGDMNKINDDFGTFDSVIFCASLHHSSNIPRSLEVAHNLLRPGGVVAIHGEHYDPMFLAVKKRRRPNTPHTIRDFSKLLRDAGLRPVVFRYGLPGRRFPRLQPFVLAVPPFKYVNGWFRFASFIMLGVK